MFWDRSEICRTGTRSTRKFLGSGQIIAVVVWYCIYTHHVCVESLGSTSNRNSTLGILNQVYDGIPNFSIEIQSVVPIRMSILCTLWPHSLAIKFWSSPTSDSSIIIFFYFSGNKKFNFVSQQCCFLKIMLCIIYNRNICSHKRRKKLPYNWQVAPSDNVVNKRLELTFYP